MPELFLIVCLAGAPNDCRAVGLPLETNGMMACLQEGQLQLVTWTQEHPEYVVKSWRCGRPPQEASQ